MFGKIVVVAALLAILYNLGAGLYFMMVENGGTGRTVGALTRRIGLSVLLILLVILGIWLGIIKPHDGQRAAFASAGSRPCGPNAPLEKKACDVSFRLASR